MKTLYSILLEELKLGITSEEILEKLKAEGVMDSFSPEELATYAAEARSLEIVKYAESKDINNKIDWALVALFAAQAPSLEIVKYAES